MLENENGSVLPSSNTETSGRIYPQLLGKDWHKMPFAMQAMHLTTDVIFGVFNVTHGKSIFTKLIARLLNCPKESNVAQITLRITPDSGIEKWHRIFDQDHLITNQWINKQGFLIEQWGKIQMQFQLQFDNKTLHYRQKSSSLHFGKYFLQLPTWLQPKINAFETIGENNNQIIVHVDVKLPFIGKLIQYDGKLNLSIVD